jgi:hypothetical protein
MSPAKSIRPVGLTVCREESMPRTWYNHKPDPAKDRQSVEDFLAWRFPELTSLNNCQNELALVRSQVIELERHGLEQGLVNLQWQAVQLSGERL